ncbi:hypothetical protein DOTSEDRAFT_29718 [Dothistroma septosporum NZE10]|uniref:Uncharacterized protein n=1 Tax=Dothistroma septosporum (strain NZE10 / CBS 128990) TaxID=675120 RepID=M2YI10_DOTSN|nr:hypothetical protein DOTSEDRAFT_29718 [Dothistroma septosporum NZE10]
MRSLKRKRGSGHEDEHTPPAPMETTRRSESPGKSVSLATPYTTGDRGTSMFESLEIGVRLDIGISTAENGHRFFVNEISREWYVDMFSFTMAVPKTRFVTAIANARNHYFFGPETEEEEAASGFLSSSRSSLENVDSDEAEVLEDDGEESMSK